jgi:D-alanine-D-alanine ligase
MHRKQSIAILYGGRSVEHGVSVNSARNIFEYIDRDKYEPMLIGISPSGQWFLTQSVTKEMERGIGLGLILDPAHKGFFLLSSGDRLKADVVFPVLHGTDGEDGSIQGMLKAMDMPMVGTGVLGSAVSMNKIVAKRLMKDAGLPVNKFLTFRYDEQKTMKYETIAKQLGDTFMVKSASLGSSVGVSKVTNRSEFQKAVADSFFYDHEVVVEEFIKGREIECAILGNDPPEASYPGEIVISSKYDFYTFDAKYVDGEAVRIEVPARLKPAVAENIREVSLKAFTTLYCEDFARVDLFLTSRGKVYINEINTIPGFTNASMYPMMWKERGLSFTELISRLIELAAVRFESGKRIARNFQSNLKF